MRIDAHQHFWRYDESAYPWIGDDMGVLARDFGPEDLAPLLADAGIDGAVAVQARQDDEETRELLGHAREQAHVVGVVGWVDLTAEDVDSRLEELAGDPHFIGVRHIVQDEPDDRFLARTDFRRGLARLASYGLTYDLLIHPRHLPVAVEVVRELPGVSFVLDHIAKPFVARGDIEPWASGLRALGALPNVACKVSGLVTEADWRAWKPADFRPYLDVVFEAFGAHRLMFGSDWPVCLLAADYGSVFELVCAYAGFLPEAEQDALFGGNAVRIYGLKENP